MEVTLEAVRIFSDILKDIDEEKRKRVVDEHRHLMADSAYERMYYGFHYSEQVNPYTEEEWIAMNQPTPNTPDLETPDPTPAGGKSELTEPQHRRATGDGIHNPELEDNANWIKRNPVKTRQAKLQRQKDKS